LVYTLPSAQERDEPCERKRVPRVSTEDLGGKTNMLVAVMAVSQAASGGFIRVQALPGKVKTRDQQLVVLYEGSADDMHQGIARLQIVPNLRGPWACVDKYADLEEEERAKKIAAFQERCAKLLLVSIDAQAETPEDFGKVREM
jgi:hypothetical protein